MKKLLNIIGLSTALLLGSCDMNKIPQGSIDEKEAFSSIESIENLELGGYARLRLAYSPYALLVPDIQADYVNALQGFSNTYAQIYKWNYRQSEEEIDYVWAYCYQTIAHCNFVLDGTAELELPTVAETDRLNLVRGRMYLMRAMSYSILAERFCVDYDESTAKADYSGVPLVIKTDREAKPGRATLYEVYDRILKDISEAKLSLSSQKGAANSVYLNSDCVSAFEAHVCLQMDNYKGAYDAATKLISSSAYALAKNYDEFADIWTYDRGTEIIFKFAASKTEVPSAFGSAFYYDQQAGAAADKGEYSWACDFIPTQSLIDAFDANDFRAKAWFKLLGNFQKKEYCWAGQNMIIPGYTVVTKFPGNPELRPSNLWNQANAWKVFRLPEMYLIAAEAALMDPSVLAGSNGTTGPDAATLINTLRAHRNLTTPLATVSMSDLKAERYKELMLEGYRMTDLKRWGDNIQRGVSQQAEIYRIDPIDKKLYLLRNDYIAISEARDLKVNIDDYRVLWPIPSEEIYANQTLAGQQNPGWEQ